MAIDGNSIINRAFYGVRHLSASDGTPTNAVYGFLNILQKLISEESPDALCVAFDLPEPTFRHEMYDGYKAQRKPMPDELRVQMPIIKEALDALNIMRVEQPGWEADDLLGAFSQKCDAERCECVIVTGDKDALQLVTDFTRVKHVKTQKGQTITTDYTVSAFVEEYGFLPEKMIDLKALMGDPSDNIPGVSGVGEKTAMNLVQSIGGIETIYGGIETHDIKDAVRKKLLDGHESAKMSYDLAKIRTDAPIESNVCDAKRREPDSDALYRLFQRLSFKSLTEKFGLRPPVAGAVPVGVPEPEIVAVTTPDERAKLLNDAARAECVTLRLAPDFYDAAVAIPGESAVYTLCVGGQHDDTLNTLLSGAVKKSGHDIKDTMRACLERGLDTVGWVFDTALAAYLISPTDNSYDLTRLSEAYCGYTPGESADTDGQMSLMEDSGQPLAREAYATELLRSALGEKLKEMELERLYYDIELPLCRVLADMENAGFLVDKPALLQYGQSLSTGIEETQKQIFDLAGEEFNLNSPKQLGTILFDKLMLPAPKKTKTGYSTNIEVLDHLSGFHPIIDLIKDYRELSKLKSTYADGLVRAIGADGRIHTHFQMTVTATGRLSSVEPNLQNIPVRKETELRKMFIAGDGNVLVDADYSQIELRLLAHIADDPVMIDAFRRGEDIHTVTAGQVFGVPANEVTPLQRSRAKAVNFGIVYGISGFSLAQDIGVMPKEAKAYIDSYLEKYAGVREYMTSIVASARECGYVETLFGRRRYLPELKSGNHNTRAFGERVALNMPIQGTAADIMKIAMIRVSNRLRKLEARLILQVHDELIAECPESEAEEVSLILREEMERAADLTVPLVADVRFGKSWHDAK